MDKSTYNQSLPVYQADNGVEFDLLDLKVSLLNYGIQVDEEIYIEFEDKYRLSKSPYSCNSMILDEQVSCSLSRTNQDTPFQYLSVILLSFKDGICWLFPVCGNAR